MNDQNEMKRNTNHERIKKRKKNEIQYVFFF